MKRANIIILQWRKWSHFQPNPTPAYFSGRCYKTTCRPTKQERSKSNLIIKGNFHTLLRCQVSPPVSAAVVLPPTFPRWSLVFPTSKTAHRFQSTGIPPPIMGSLDRSRLFIFYLYAFSSFPFLIVSIFFPMNANSILLLLCFFVFRSSDAGIVTVDVKTAENLLHSGYAFLDVRLILR